MELTLLQIASLIASLVSVGGVVYLGGVKLAKLEVKVDTMWEFTLRRAKFEAVDQGLASFNSPLVVFPETRRHMEILMPALREIYKAHRKLKDADLALELERAHGEKILRDVCRPLKIHMGACLVIAVQMLRDENTGALT